MLAESKGETVQRLPAYLVLYLVLIAVSGAVKTVSQLRSEMIVIAFFVEMDDSKLSAAFQLSLFFLLDKRFNFFPLFFWYQGFIAFQKRMFQKILHRRILF